MIPKGSPFGRDPPPSRIPNRNKPGGGGNHPRRFAAKFPFTDDEPAFPDYPVSVELCAFSAKEMLSAQAVFGAEAPARQ